MTERILLVEDESDLANTVKYCLEQEGYSVRVASTGREALDAMRDGKAPDLVLLDLMLPDASGKDICREIRSDHALSAVPIIMVTAMGTELDRVVGFEVGADDYVVKPFSVRELVLRVRARLKHRAATMHGKEIVRVGSLSIDVSGHEVTVQGQPVALTALEFRLLITLFEREGRVQSRSQLLEVVWGYSGDVNTRTVDTHMRRLREKLGEAGQYIETVRGVGYCFRNRSA